MPGAEAGALGSWFSHSDPADHLSRGHGLRPCHGTESGRLLCLAVIIISILTIDISVT